MTQTILQEKTKTQPNKSKIQNWQKKIDGIEIYKKQGTIIRSKETQIVNEEIPNKFFFQQEQQKQSEKQRTQLKNNKKENLTRNSKLLKGYQQFYQTLYEKQNNCQIMQKELLKNIQKKSNNRPK